MRPTSKHRTVGRRERHPTPKPPRSGHRVVTLVYDGLASFEFGVAVEFFGLRRAEFPSWYDFSLASVDGGSVRATGGYTLSGARSLAALREADTIVIPGWRGVDTPVPARLVRELVAAHARGARIISFCSGAFIVAATGLLTGRRITTHWRYAAAMKERHPNIHVDPDVLYVDEGSILTSAGSAAAVDLCLHVVRRDWGAEVANTVARRLVVPPHRDGGQSQFIQTPLPKVPGPSPLASTMAWARQHLDQELDVAELAKRACMSERTFARAFRQLTGTTPYRWLTHERILRAEALLEETHLSIDEVAERSGFGSPITLRQHFARSVGISPSDYRARFAKTKPRARAS